jgi:hypothetical protein
MVTILRWFKKIRIQRVDSRQLGRTRKERRWKRTRKLSKNRPVATEPAQCPQLKRLIEQVTLAKGFDRADRPATKKGTRALGSAMTFSSRADGPGDLRSGWATQRRLLRGSNATENAGQVTHFAELERRNRSL